MNASTISAVDGSLDESHYGFTAGGGQENMGALIDIIATVLRRANRTLCFLETITGGMVCDLFWAFSKISDICSGSLILSRTELYTTLLQIPELYIQNVGAASKEIARSLAEQGAAKFGADFCVASCGSDGEALTRSSVNGWIAICGTKRTITQRVNFPATPANPNLVREQFTYATFRILVQFLFEDWADL